VYIQMFGGSALLHLLAAHPKVVALFGIAATATMLLTPLGPGRYIGSGSHLARIEAAVRPQAAITEARQAAAERAAARLLARQNQTEIAGAVTLTLERCGAGCTDISTARIISNPELLRRVLVLHELDFQARAAGNRTGRN